MLPSPLLWLHVRVRFVRSNVSAPVPGGFGAGRQPSSWGWRVKHPGPAPRTPTQTLLSTPRLTFERRRRDGLLFATPEQLLRMADYDRAGLMRRFKQALDHVLDTGRLQPSDLQLPIKKSPPTIMQPLTGYEGGMFDPLQLGVACIVLPEGRAPTKGATWNFNPVSSLTLPPSPLPDRPLALQLILIVQSDLDCA